MTWLILALIAQIILGTAVVFDALLLRRRVSDPVIYTFWIGVLGVFSAILLPFGFLPLSYSLIILGIISGIIFIISLLILYTILTKINALPTFFLIAAFTPLWVLPFSSVFINAHITVMDGMGMALLIGGALFFFRAEQKELRMHLIILTAASAGLYACSVILQKIVFEHSNFITGFFWTKIGGVFFVFGFLLVPHLRKKILFSHTHLGGTNGIYYFSNRIWAAIGSVLISIAISFSHPALVESTQSFRYVVIFIASILILHERFHGRTLWLKICATVCIVSGITWLGLVNYARSIPYDVNRGIVWGVTFSEKFSRRLGLDPKENLNAILNDLRPSTVRLIAYWDEIESSRGTFDFSSLDWQIEKAAQMHTNVILAVGMRVPRWPECFMPEWAKSLDIDSRENAILDYLAAIRNHYENHPAISIWQIENEPFLYFGQCPDRGKYFLEKEIEIFRIQNAIPHSIRPILITDGGEFGKWYTAAKHGDIFGTTMYRKVYPPSIGHYTGAFEYPIAPSFFRLKEKIIRFLLQDYTKPFIVIELQAEPWGKVEIPLLSVDDQVSLFPPDYFKETIEYAKETGFGNYYLWGAEWWYMMGMKYNNWQYWNIAKNTITGS